MHGKLAGKLAGGTGCGKGLCGTPRHARSAPAPGPAALPVDALVQKYNEVRRDADLVRPLQPPQHLPCLRRPGPAPRRPPCAAEPAAQAPLLVGCQQPVRALPQVG
jgi:hypothetical protein